MTTNYTIQDVEEALNFAIEKHGSQKYGNRPYSYHLNSVLGMVIKMGLSFEFQIVAVLHDTIEDTDTTWGELCHVFGENVGGCVYGLSRAEFESYDDYILRLSDFTEIKKIKICDLLCNLRESYLMNEGERKTKLIDKYEKAILLISTG